MTARITLSQNFISFMNGGIKQRALSPRFSLYPPLFTIKIFLAFARGYIPAFGDRPTQPPVSSALRKTDFLRSYRVCGDKSNSLRNKLLENVGAVDGPRAQKQSLILALFEDFAGIFLLGIAVEIYTAFSSK